MLAASVSLVEILVSSIRYNERTASNGVKLMVAVPFLFTTLCFRLIGLAMLFAFFQQEWVALAIAMLFCVNVISVQVFVTKI